MSIFTSSSKHKPPQEDVELSCLDLIESTTSKEEAIIGSKLLDATNAAMMDATIEQLKLSESFYYTSPKETSTPFLSKLATNMRYQFAELTSERISFNNPHECVYMLGKVYLSRIAKLPYPNLKPFSVRGDPEFLARMLKEDFQRIIWVTYRNKFRPMDRLENGTVSKRYSTDAGWGCTVRVGQMMLLNTLKRHMKVNEDRIIELIEMVQDNHYEAPYSIHKLAKVGENLGMKPGDWYAPSTICHVIEGLYHGHINPKFRCMVFMDSVIYKDQLYERASEPEETEIIDNSISISICDVAVDTETSSISDIEDLGTIKNAHRRPRSFKQEWDFSMLVMVPLMLGLGRIHPDFYETIKFFLRQPCSVGIIGGKPRSALYLVGYQNDNLIYLDPHFVQPACSNLQDLQDNLSTYFCNSIRLLPFENAESSISLCLYFKNRASFEEFEQSCLTEGNAVKGVLSIQEYTPNYYYDDTKPQIVNDGSSDDDYVLL